MKRTVFFLPEPAANPDWRVPIATIGDGPVTPIPHEIDPRWCADVPRILSLLASAPELDGTTLPADVGPHAILGDLVRVTYPDGGVVDLDELAPVGWRTVLLEHRYHEPMYELMARDPGEAGDSLYFHRGPRALPVIPIFAARGGHALIEGVAGHWHRIYVESWEDEARRLRAAPFTPTLRDLDRLMSAFGAISFREFCVVLRRTNGAAEDYCRGVWGPFRDHPLGFCSSRGPISQGEGLLALALAKLHQANQLGRVIGCPGKGCCHEGQYHCASCGDVARICEIGEDCPVHGAVSDAQIQAAVMQFFQPLPGARSRERHSPRNLARDLAERFSAHRVFDIARVEGAIAALLAAGKLEPQRLYEGAVHPLHTNLQAPLGMLRPGEHSDQCPVTVEHWNERAAHNPDVCAWIPAEDFDRRVLDLLVEHNGGGFIADGGISAREIAETLRCAPADAEKACQRLGARAEAPLWFPPPEVEDDAEEASAS